LRVVLVLSQANYVKDNYFHLLSKLLSSLPEGVEIVGIVLIKTVEFKLVLKCFGLYLIGVRKLSITLLKNIFSSLFYDKRRKLAKKYDIPVVLVDNINRKKARELIGDMKPDLIINARTRNIYRGRILSLPTIGCINIHHGILPDNRGTMCDLWAWVEKRPVGFSIHWMNKKIDDGDIIAKSEIDVSDIESYVDIPMKSSITEAELLIEVMEKIRDNHEYRLERNITNRENYTRNPTWEEIAKIRKMGLKL
jgi:methionyl-tRNA formyltransferase